MIYLVTGCAGFIGFHLSNNLLKNTKNKVYGIDSLNNYYSTKIKKERLKILKKKKNFFFKKIDLIDKKKIRIFFSKINLDYVFHLAGQPGVLYSFKNPKSYKSNNILATKNLLNEVNKNKIRKFIFASSSSVYGDQKRYPIKETFKVRPINYYASTKIVCEKLIRRSFANYKSKFIIFRFFTVYGPYGRPDMFIHKLLNKAKKKKVIKLHNFGKNLRDYTYIDDVVKILKNCIKLEDLKLNIFNICKSQPIETNKLIKKIQKSLKRNIKFKLIPKVKGEMYITHGSNQRIIKSFKLGFTSIDKGIEKTIKAYNLKGF
tara:strand:- start:1123 stop:2073 length:951 start_codon:yes stop_codon:yes gene_type:complete